VDSLETIRFKSGDLSCVGDLFIPAECGPSNRCPGLLLGRGFSGVRGPNVDIAQFFQRAGYVTLAIDYRTFGQSEGEPRGQLFPLNQVEDCRNGISYLQTRPEVDADRIALWGPSFAGGVVIYAAAFDRRVKAVVAVTPIVDGRRWMRSLRTSEQWEQLLLKLDQDRRTRYETGAGGRVKVTGRGSLGEFCAMPSDQEFVDFFAQTAKLNKMWRQDITLESIERILEFNPASVIHLIAPRPLLIITTTGYDTIHPVEQVQSAFGSARDPKELVLLPEDQLGLYREPGLSVALGHSVTWFDRYLRSPLS
jgi:fermentation-respiration switch protein FrsA (DUF1100 family)